MSLLRLQRRKVRTGLAAVPYRDTHQGQLIYGGQAKSGWTFTNAAGTVVSHPASGLDPLLSGSNCLRIVTSTSGDSSVFQLGHNFSGVEGFTIALYWPHATAAAVATISLASATNLTNSHSWKHYLTEGMNFIRVHRGTPTATNGTIDYSSIRRLSLTIASADKTAYVCWIRTGLYSRPALFIGADDEYDNNLTVLQPLMDEYGFGDKGYLAWSKYFDDREAAYMNQTQVRQLRDLGWDICNHSRDHVDHENASVATIYDDFSFNRDYMLANGLDSNGSAHIVVYPFGGGTSGVQANHQTAMQQMGCPMARSVLRGKMTTTDNPSWPSSLSYASERNYLAKIINPYTAAYKDAATVIAEIKELIAYGGTAWFMLHSTPEAAAGDSGNPLIYNSGDIETVLDWLNANRAQIDVMKPTEYLASLGRVTRVSPSFATYSSMPVVSKIYDADNSLSYTDAGTTAASVGSAVYQINDLVGGASPALQTTAGSRPTLRSGTNNGKTFRYLEFVDNDDYLQSASIGTIAQPLHVVVVAQITILNTGNNQVIFDGIAAGNRSMLYKNNSDKWSATAGTVVSDTNSTPDTAWHIFELVNNGVRSKLIIDGVVYSDDNGAHSLTGVTIGNRWDPGGTGPQGGNMNIAYVGLWTTDHQMTGWMERHRAYLADRYGITLTQAPYDYA